VGSPRLVDLFVITVLGRAEVRGARPPGRQAISDRNMFSMTFRLLGV